MDKPKKKPPRVIDVVRKKQLTPNMIRLTFEDPSMINVTENREGANCKIFLPINGQSKAAFLEQCENGPRPTVRTYTVRNFRNEGCEIDIDFVAHGDEGPASKFAKNCQVGDFIGFTGPSDVKMAHFEADWYLFAADMAAIPVAAAHLKKLPKDAKGIAIFEIMEEGDRQDIYLPEGMDAHWIVQGDPHLRSNAQEDFIRSLNWPNGRIQTCIAGESGVIKKLRAFLHQEKNLPREDTYISGYWKIGLIEDEHQIARKEGKAG